MKTELNTITKNSMKIIPIALFLLVILSTGAWGQDVSISIPTLPPGKQITITYSVEVTTPVAPGVNEVSNQGQVSGSNFSTVLTDDPDVGGASDPTVTELTTSPEIVTDPISQTICTGYPVTFTVTATGDGLTYQWRKDGTDISGETNDSYTIDEVSSADAGDYDVIVSGSSPPDDTSAAATLTVTPPPTFQVAMNPTFIWSQTHSLRTVTATIDVTGGCSTAVSLVSITSSEADAGLGGGDVANDIQDASIGTDDRSVSLRAEAGTNAGRLYTITYRVTDGAYQEDIVTVVPSLPLVNGVYNGPIISPPNVVLEGPDPSVLLTTSDITYTIPTSSATSIDLFTLQGVRVAAIKANSLQAAGTYTVTWNGNLTTGLPAPNGTYIYMLKACSVKRVGVITVSH